MWYIKRRKISGQTSRTEPSPEFLIDQKIFFFDLVSLAFCIGIPYGSNIFQLRPEKCAIRHFPCAWMFSFDISPDKVKGFCSIAETHLIGSARTGH